MDLAEQGKLYFLPLTSEGNCTGVVDKRPFFLVVIACAGQGSPEGLPRVSRGSGAPLGQVPHRAGLRVRIGRTELCSTVPGDS